MNINRSVQLTKLRTLYELRERESLTKLHEQQKCVELLEATAKDIQRCVDEYTLQLKTLDDQRLHENALTVVMLQESVASRLIIQRDLSKERIYLKTALEDISAAMDELAKRRSQWHECVKRLDALITFAQNAQKLELQYSQVVIDRELDDLALSRHGAAEHG